MEKQHFPHDEAYKRFFSDIEVIISFLLCFVEANFVKYLKLDTLQKCFNEFITSDFHRRQNDMIWRVQWRNDTWMYLVILQEFQSKPDYFMASRIAEYSIMLQRHLSNTHIVKPGERYAILQPIVIYNGEAEWKAPLSMDGLNAEIPDELTELRRAQVRQSYILIDERRIPEEKIKKTSGLASIFIRLERARNKDEIMSILNELKTTWRNDKYSHARKVIAQWLYVVSNLAEEKGIKPEEIKDLNGVGYMLAENMAKWRKEDQQKFKAEGIAQGFAQGIAKGRVEGRDQGIAVTKEEKMIKSIARCHKLNATHEQIIDMLIEDYDLSKDEAERQISAHLQ